MSSWLGSAVFVLFSALFGCILGFGLAACRQGFKERRSGARETGGKNEDKTS